MATLKGQNLRVFIGANPAVVGEAISCQITLTNNTQDMSTKDDVGMSEKPTTTSKSWQVQVETLDVSNIGTFLTAIKNGTAFQLQWDETETSDNTTGMDAAFGRKGSAYCTDLTVNFNDREYATQNVTFTGTGALQNLS